jgi:hypothetical protein
MELNYLSGLFEINDRDTVFPDLPNHNPGLAKADRRISEVIMAMWIRFVKPNDLNAEGHKITAMIVEY